MEFALSLEFKGGKFFQFGLDTFERELVFTLLVEFDELVFVVFVFIVFDVVVLFEVVVWLIVVFVWFEVVMVFEVEVFDAFELFEVVIEDVVFWFFTFVFDVKRKPPIIIRAITIIATIPKITLFI